MAKYEKFEEWMLDASVVTSNGEKGVVEDYLGDDVYVAFKNGTSCWYAISDLEFPEGKEETSPTIPWQVGQVVWDLLDGKGVVTRITHNQNPIGIQFDNGKSTHAFRDGSQIGRNGVRTIFFSEPTIIAETLPPKKPFVPKLKEGDKVLIKDKQGLFGEGTVRVVHKECDDRVYISKDGNYFMKHDIASLQVLSEEIKWD